MGNSGIDSNAVATVVLARRSCSREHLIERDQRRQDAPIGRIDAGETAHDVAAEATAIADVAPMHPSDDEAAEHKKEVDADVEIAQMAAKAFDAEKARFGENVVGVMENDERRGAAPTQFQQAKLRARARRAGRRVDRRRRQA